MGAPEFLSHEWWSLNTYHKLWHYSPGEAHAWYLRDWHFRWDNRENKKRWRFAALKYEWHSHLLDEIMRRYTRKLKQLRPGTYPSAFVVGEVFHGSPESVASKIVLARERRDYDVHHMTENSVFTI